MRMLHRPFLLAEDRRAGGEELHLGRLRKFLQVALGSRRTERAAENSTMSCIVVRMEVCLIAPLAGGWDPTGDAGVASGDRRVRASPPRS
jgi:hypothetical protein